MPGFAATQSNRPAEVTAAPTAVAATIATISKAVVPNKAASQSVALVAVLDRLDAVDDKRFRNRRSNDRLPFRCFEVPARISHPGGSRTVTTVATRNLSVSGIGLIANRFLHNGTRIELVLRRMLDQAPDLLIGTVVFCTHVGGTMHQVGVRFDQKLFPALYVDIATLS